MIGAAVWDDSDVSEESVLSEELEELPAGVELAGLLASVDRDSLGGDDVLRVAAARQRLIAHQEAQLLADLHRVARVVPTDVALPRSVTRQAAKYPWAEVECAFALRWTHARAAGQLIFADEVIDRFPALFAALNEGRVDVPKARIIADLLGPMDDALAAALVEKIVEQAEQWTTGQLRARLRRLVLAADPEAVAAKAREGVRSRRVVAYPDGESGLASLAGYELAPQRVAAVIERLDAVAKAAKAAGDERSTDQLRADAFIDLLTGEGIAVGGPLSDGGLELAGGNDSADEQDAPLWWPGGAVSPPEPVADDHEPDLPPDPEPGVDLWAFGVPEPSPEVDGEVPVLDPGALAWWADRFDQLPAARVSQPASGALPGPRRGVVEITCGLQTLMGLAELPAELTGYGPVAADIARQVIAQMSDAQWRFSVYDRMDRLAHHGITTTRPDDDHETKRRPDAPLAAFVKARDRVCVAPGCRKAARRCDIDHSLDWIKGGETVHCNLALLCRAHHLFKHSAGCELVQLSPGVFVWQTPLGLQYLTRSQPPLLEENQLAGIPKPGNTDATAIDVELIDSG